MRLFVTCRRRRTLPCCQLLGRLTREDPQTLMNTLRPSWSRVFTTHLTPFGAIITNAASCQNTSGYAA